MATGPTNRNLLIPGKNYSGAHDGYKKDAQTIEMWARQPIQQLIAGANITLSPASGLATDSKGRGPNPVTISATGGGGGGANVGLCQATLMPDFNTLSNSFLLSFGPQDDSGNFTNIDLFGYPVSAPTPAATYGKGWYAVAAAGWSACIFPAFDMPAFTGNPIQVDAIMAVTDASWTNYLITFNATHSFTSAGVYQFQASDFTVAQTGGTDLSIVAGSGNFGNGIVSAGGGFYFGSIYGRMQYDNTVVFT